MTRKQLHCYVQTPYLFAPLFEVPAVSLMMTCAPCAEHLLPCCWLISMQTLTTRTRSMRLLLRIESSLDEVMPVDL
jgi:hypothetical protein